MFYDVHREFVFKMVYLILAIKYISLRKVDIPMFYIVKFLLPKALFQGEL
ncbi:hypothetical protein GCM10011346_51110 [Oceanobacillus neutriphilus]|uniref:Uncharacterized protein n=1 Tax=Oceanobacillus neutriphilus TaxID=531815 RepID=A0ABQ2P3D1_9BACI|nr:hypothetical protein GCM10011346_51110 [Oceanobacillus neutriphilus]